VRFGDKYLNNNIPLSVCFIDPVPSSESREQLRQFLISIGSVELIEQISALPQADQIASVLQLGFRHLRRGGATRSAALVQRTVSGVLNDKDGYGVAYTRNPRTGLEEDWGKYLYRCTGREFNFDYVGSPLKMALGQLENDAPNLYWQIRTALQAVELILEDTKHVEFVVEDQIVWIVQATTRRRIQPPLSDPTKPVCLRWVGPELACDQSDILPVWQKVVLSRGADAIIVSSFSTDILANVLDNVPSLECDSQLDTKDHRFCVTLQSQPNTKRFEIFGKPVLLPNDPDKCVGFVHENTCGKIVYVPKYDLYFTGRSMPASEIRVVGCRNGINKFVKYIFTGNNLNALRDCLVS